MIHSALYPPGGGGVGGLGLPYETDGDAPRLVLRV